MKAAGGPAPGLLAAVVAGAIAVLAASAGTASPAPKPLSGDLRSDLRAIRTTPDVARVARLLPGRRPGEIGYFVVLDGERPAGHGAALERAGARVLREYTAIDAFAVASTARVASRVARLPGVARLVPIEVVQAEIEQEVDQSRGTTGDVAAPALWAQGITGSGIRIAILDTGADITHPDLDDLDFRRWSSVLNPRKVVDARNFVGGGCAPLLGATDFHGHGTHVAGIAAGTGEGTPLADDDGRYAGIAPDAELAIAKVLTDAGAGLNSDLLAALEWAAMPAGSSPCSIGAHVVNLSLGSESRPTRLNTGSDLDLVSLMLNRLAVRYGTVFVAAAGNGGPFLGSVLESPGAAAQALSVGASAKDYDLNHDDTLSGDTCAGYQHPPSATNDCNAGVGTQPPSLAAFSSRGPSGDLWLKPDLSAPGYNIVAPQTPTGAAIAQVDLSPNTRTDPLYATASGTSMAAPAATGTAALLLEGYRDRHGSLPSGSSGVAGLTAPAYALVRAALMNTAGVGQYESRWILSTGGEVDVPCPADVVPFIDVCAIVKLFTDFAGNVALYEVRNGAADPYVGALGEGAGKVHAERALAALRDGVVVYSAASGSGQDAGTGPRDLQGSWQVGAIGAGTSTTQDFVLHAAPGVSASARFEYATGRLSDGTAALPGSWVRLPSGSTTVRAGRDQVVKLRVSVPSSAPAGTYVGAVRVRLSTGQLLEVPVLAVVAMHDPDRRSGNTPGPQGRFASGSDVYAKWDTSWPSVVGAAGTGAGSDFVLFPVELEAGLTQARFTVHDSAAGDETYDLYLYDRNHDLVASTHPFAAPGVTDVAANDARRASTPVAPQVLSVAAPAAGSYSIAVSRAKVGAAGTGDFGSFVLTHDAVAP